MTKHHLTPVNRSLIAAGVLLSSLPALAQQSPSTDRKANGIQEVVVTATKVATPASKTPLALSVVSGDDLKDAGITEARALEEIAPNVQMGQDSGRLQIAIRGVVSLDMTEKGDPSASFNVDGAYIARYEAQMGAFMDLERVEVLRGPQGTLYGRNATAGAINLITNKPTKYFAARVEGEIGNYGSRRIEGMINVPINKMFSLRAVAQKSERDGYVKPGTNTGTPMDSKDDYAGRVHLLADISKDTSLLLTAETSHQGGGAPTPVPMGNFFTGTYVDNLPFSPANTGNNIEHPVYVDKGTSYQRTANLNFKGASNPAFTENSNNSFRSEFKTRLSFADLTYQYAYMKGEIDGSGNGIYFGFPIVITGKGDSTSNSHELRLNSNDNGPLKWVAGVYLFDETIHRKNGFNTFITAPFGSFTVVLPFDIEVKNKSAAAFGQATYSLSPATRLTLGLRETHDQKDGSDKLGGTAAVPPATTSTGAYTKSVKFNNTGWRLGLEQDVSADTMTYASLATGYKAGGFNDTSDGGDYKPEHLTALEGGIKTKLMNDRLRVSAGFFVYDYKDMQQTSVVCKTADPSSCGSLTTNAAAAKIKGAEIEARLMVGESGQLRSSLALNDAKFDNYKPNSTTDWSGQRLDRAPTSVISLGYSHRFNLSSGSDITASLSTRWNSGYTLSDPEAGIRYKQPSFQKSDASLGWTSSDTKTTVQVFVKNLEDTVTIESRVPGSFFIGDPRTFGVRASYNF